ncbi:hypothetical protein [Paenibacillus sacheonensis]|uniref:Uncharacterized protein n=1 Tax=Paenibacillus sacheonensis TaxID=742054 RepID=A0A7X5C3Y6_9BACL|nr:hypothetical protein [Paenibacillus sacheonensis]MBM7569024.1 hypothetical protein [Paenibacillus sacheonensis]NBC72795.1 hypothetical protein [Paenibacillus sacheonensis]
MASVLSLLQGLICTIRRLIQQINETADGEGCRGGKESRASGMQPEHRNPKYAERAVHGPHPFVSDLMDEITVTGQSEQNRKASKTRINMLIVYFRK